MIIRPAEPSDSAAIYGLIRGLAEYEKELDQVESTEESIAAALFGEGANVFAHVAVVEGVVVGTALWFRNFSTWTGRTGIYLEDLFVLPERRGEGVGTALLKALATLCVERGYGRFQWSVLDWNESAINFYRSIGAEPLADWTIFGLDRDALTAFAAR
jgi:GNAT superfamily N-acetyltransferase